ncbi:MAG: hypothetical protein Q8L73_09020 [Methylotenera sp.]|nr:hypothetical protein [Methylotenera sp.]
MSSLLVLAISYKVRLHQEMQLIQNKGNAFNWWLAQNHEVVALDILADKVEMLNKKKSPIVDAEIEDFFSNKILNFRATSICPSICQ